MLAHLKIDLRPLGKMIIFRDRHAHRTFLLYKDIMIIYLCSGTWLWELELHCWECRWGTSGGDKDLWNAGLMWWKNTDDENTDDTEDTDDENTGALQIYEMGEWCDENPAALFSRSDTWGLIWTRKTEEGHTDIMQTFEYCSINAGIETFLLSKGTTHTHCWACLGLLEQSHNLIYVTH